MSLTIYEVLCNARYNLDNAVFPFQIEMAKEQLANALDAIDNGKTLNDVWEEAQPNAAVPYKPTLTPPNEPLTCEGCACKEYSRDSYPCNSCFRNDETLSDQYRPPGEWRENEQVQDIRCGVYYL